MRWAQLSDGRWVNPHAGATDNAAGLEWLIINEGVAATGHQGNLFVAFAYRDSTSIVVQSLTEGGPTPIQPPDEARTQTVPSLASDGTNLNLAWRVADSTAIASTVLTNSGWGPVNTRQDVGTRTGPALAVAGAGNIVMVWPGMDGDPAMWWFQFSEGQWSDRQAFADRQMVGSCHIGLA